MSECLVLNRSFLAVEIAEWKKVLSLVYQGHAEVVDENYQTFNFDEWCELSKAMSDNPGGFVHTPTLRIAVPDVIRLTLYERLPSRLVKFTRRNIYEHYDYTCCYCGERKNTKDLNLDHVVPRSKGGGTNWDNIVLSCIPCNLRKADKTPAEAGMKLLVKPSRPEFGPMDMVLRSPIKMKQSWQNFIDKAYWDTPIRP